jgi:hypothetical protein
LIDKAVIVREASPAQDVEESTDEVDDEAGVEGLRRDSKDTHEKGQNTENFE